jgi:hypothetical protein
LYHIRTPVTPLSFPNKNNKLNNHMLYNDVFDKRKKIQLDIFDKNWKHYHQPIMVFVLTVLTTPNHLLIPMPMPELVK